MLNEFALRLFKDNSDLRDFIARTGNLQSVTARREAVRIAVIDDEPFLPQNNLRSYNYNIQALGDVKSLKEVAGYHMILCDVMGVGRHFDPSLQGASLIAELKKLYPEKVVIAYTGAAMTERAAKIATQRADRTFKKDISLEDWTRHLDELAPEAIDPYQIWNKLRRRFVELDVRTRDIIVLEDGYVRSVLAQDPRFGILLRQAATIQVQQDVRAIIQGLAASLIFKALFPGA